MATSRTPSREPESSYNLTSSPSPRRTQYTFSTQRAEFTKPVPAALLPVYPTFDQESDSDDEASASIANLSTKPMAMHQGTKNGPSAAEGNSQTRSQDVDTMATVGRTTLVRGFAEKSGISPTSNLTHLHTADFDNKIDDMEVQPQTYSNSVVARFASLLGLQKIRPAKSTSNTLPSPTEVPPLASYSRDLKHSPFPSPLRFDSLRPDSNLLANNRLNAEDHCNTNMPAVIEDDRELPCDSPIESEQLELPGQANEPLKQRKQGQGSSYTSATYPPPVQPNRFLRHRRSRSLDIRSAPATSIRTSNRASSMDDQRCRKTTSMDGSLWLSQYHVPLVNVPPNCVLVQVWAVGLDESDRKLVVGSDGCIVDEAHDFKRSQETANQGWEKCKERREEGAITHSIFNGSKLLGWSLDFWAKKKKKVDWPLSISDRQTMNGKQMVREVSLPKTPQSLEAGCIPGQSFVGRLLRVGSVVEKSFAARDDWVVGLIDIRKCGPLAEFIVIDWRQVHRVPPPYESCSSDSATSTTSTLVSELPSDKSAERVDEKTPLRHFAPLTLDELALLALCGIPAYRAVKTCIDAFPVGHDNFIRGCIIDGPTRECYHLAHGQRLRALVLRGHDGVGAMAVQMLVRQGWRVTVHVPFSRVPWDASQAEADGFMLAIEDRLKKWGVDEVIYDDGISYASWDGEMDDRKAAVVRVIETLRGDGDVFDAVLDLVGGKEIREASDRLLGLNGCPTSHGVGQFTTLLGANAALDDLIPTPDNFLNLANLSTFTLHDPRSYADEHIEGFRDARSEAMRRVKHTLIEGPFESQDEEVWEILGSVLRFALEDGIRPHIEEAGGELFGRQRSVFLEKASDVVGDGDLLSDGGTIVVRVVR